FPPSAFFSGAAPSVLAICFHSDSLLLRDRALSRSFPRARIRARALTARREIAAVPQPSIAADFHQPLGIIRDFLAQIAFDAAHFLDDAADLSHIVLGEILDANVRTYARCAEDVARPLASDPVDVGESNLDPLCPRKIDAGDT